MRFRRFLHLKKARIPAFFARDFDRFAQNGASVFPLIS